VKSITRGERYRGVQRCTRDFSNSKKRKFILKVVKRLGVTKLFRQTVQEYQQGNCSLYAAYHMALHDIGQILMDLPEFDFSAPDCEFDTPTFDHLLPDYE